MRRLLALAGLLCIGCAAPEDGTGEAERLAPGVHAPSSLRHPEALAPLSGWIGEAALIGVGEPIHRSGGFERGRAALTRFLIARGGVRVVAVEANWHEMRGLDDQLQRCAAGEQVALTPPVDRTFWGDPAMQWLDWACDWNRRRHEPVRVVGMDAQKPWHEMALLRPWLVGLDGGEAVIADLERCHGARFPDAASYRAWGREHDFPTPTAAEHADCGAGLEAARERLPADAPDLAGAVASLAAFEAQNQAVLVREDPVEAYGVRDRAMTTRLLAEWRRVGGERGAIWASNEHLAKTGGRDRGRWDNVGSRLVADADVDYAAVAMLGSEVQTRFGPRFDPEPPGPGDLEHRLQAFGTDLLLVDPDQLPAARSTARVGGLPRVAAAAFDALLYLRRSEAPR